MPRQTYISKDFFVNATENEAKDCILQLPVALSNIKFVAEDPVRHSLKFVYESECDCPQNHVDVALLPLSIDQTRVTLYGSYPDGAAILKETEISAALQNFETAINAAVKGNLSNYTPSPFRMKSSKNRLRLFFALSFLLSIFYVLKQWFF